MISAILLDFGGTLDADGLHWLDRFYGIYDRLGYSNIPKASIKEAFYWADEQAEADPAMRKAGLREMMDCHARWQIQKLGLKDNNLAAKVAESFYRPAERILRRNRHILEKLSHLGCHLGVISNFYGNVETLCREFGYEPYLQAILDSAHVGLRKPDPAFFQLGITRLGAAANETACVGDSFERDIVPAKSLGMQTFWLIGDQRRTPPVSGQADTILLSLEDLPDRVAGQRTQASPPA